MPADQLDKFSNIQGWDWDIEPISFWDKMITSAIDHYKTIGDFKLKKDLDLHS